VTKQQPLALTSMIIKHALSELSILWKTSHNKDYHFMLMSANEWMMLMLMQCKCKNASLTLGVLQYQGEATESEEGDGTAELLLKHPDETLTTYV
jgi:hypothetical protein